MLDLTKYSEQELKALKKAISKEERKRNSENFPYKVGDCFCDSEPVTKKWFTIDDVRAAIFAVKRPLEWRPGQFVFNRASELYGDIFVRSIKHDPFYNDENINPFIEALTEALNESILI